MGYYRIFMILRPSRYVVLVSLCKLYIALLRAMQYVSPIKSLPTPHLHLPSFSPLLPSLHPHTSPLHHSHTFFFYLPIPIPIPIFYITITIIILPPFHSSVLLFSSSLSFDYFIFSLQSLRYSIPLSLYQFNTLIL